MSAQIPLFEKTGTKASKVAAKVEEIVGDGFDVRKFVENFEVLVQAGGGVRSVRKLVLELAIRGRFSSRGEADGSSRKLFDAAQSDRVVRQARGQARQMEELAEPTNDEVPFALPPSWKWTRIGLAVNLVNGRAFKPKDWSTSGLPIIRIQNLNNAGAPYNYCAFEVEPKHHLNPGDFLISWSGTPGTSFGAFIWNGPSGVLNQHIFRAEIYGKAYELGFLRIAINARLDEMIAQAHGGVGLQHITKGKLEALAIPLPPLAEQKRIVAKVDQLMALCDELEARQTKKRETGARLTKSALDALTTADGPEEFDIAWKRVVENFDVLIDRAEKVGELRAAILQLAVLGKLTGHDVAGAARDLDSRTRGSGDDTRMKLPSTWRWARLGEVSELINGDRSKSYPNKAEYVQEGVAWINTGHIEPDGTLSLGSMHYISRKKFDSLRAGKVRPGDLVYCLRGATLGKTAIITQFTEGAVASSLVIIRLSPAVEPTFAYRVLTSPLGREQIFRFDNGSAQPNLSANNVKKYVIPLPPLAEQKRIVARVEQLMKVCDSLQARLYQTEDRASKLVEAVVLELVA